MTAHTIPARLKPVATVPPRRAEPAGALWARMVERWRAAPESQDDYDARQW